MTEPCVLSTVDGGVAHVVLHRPAARNAINLEMVRALSQTLDSFKERLDVQAVVFSGAGGKAFASGADIGELKERSHREALLAINGALFQAVESFPRPTIAAIEGYALGGGFELALACDLRVGTRGAKVGLPEVTLGIFPAAGGTSRLQRLVGLGRAKELVFTGRLVDGEEAYALGIFERLCESGDAVEAAMAMAKQIAGNAPLAVQIAKLSLNAAAHGSDVSAIERAGQALLFDSGEKHERMAAFLARRKREHDRG